MSIFRMCSKLVQLSIFTWEGSYPVAAANHVTLHDLVTFSVQLRALSAILEELSLPSLRDLRIRSVSATDLSSLLNLFTRSSCTLDTLELNVNEWSFRPNHYVSLLAHGSCNLLTSLRIRGSCLAPPDAGAFHRLTLHQDDSLCPRLKSLKIDCSIYESAGSTLLKMLESRISPHAGQLPGVQQLQRFHVWTKEYDGNLIKALEEFGKKIGMEYNRQRFFLKVIVT